MTRNAKKHFLGGFRSRSELVPLRHSLARPVAVVVACLAVSLAMFFHASGTAHQVALQRFQSEARNYTLAVRERFRLLEDDLRSGQVLFSASHEVTREEWRDFADAQQQLKTGRFPPIYGYGFVRRVAAEDAAEFLASRGIDDWEPQVGSLQSGEIGTPQMLHQEQQPNLSRHRYFLDYLAASRRSPSGEPWYGAAGPVALGRDLRQLPDARGMLERALDAGTTQLGSAIPLFHPGELILCAPVYAGTRKNGALGWVLISVGKDELTPPLGLFDGIDTATISGRLADGSSEALASQRRPGADGSAVQGVLETELQLGGRTLMVRMESEHLPEAPLVGSLSILLLLVGLVLSLVGGVLTYVALQSRALSRCREQDALQEAAALRDALGHYALFSITDRSGTIVDVNEGFCQVSGFDREELLGQNHRILNSGHHDRSFWVKMFRDLVKGKAWHGEVCNRAKDGSLYWVDATNLPMRNEHGGVTGYLSMRFDITARKRAEQQLAQAYDELLEAQRIGCLTSWRLDPKTRKVEWSGALHEILDLGPGVSALTFDGVLSLLDEGSSVALKAAVESAVEGAEDFSLLVCRPRSEQPSTYLRAVGRPEIGASGDVVAVLGTFVDVSEQVQQDAALREFSSAMDSANDCIFVIDVDTLKFVYVNQGGGKHLGYPPEEIIGSSPVDFLGSYTETEYRNLLDGIASRPGMAMTQRDHHTHRNGYEVPVEVSFKMVPGLGAAGRCVAVVRNISAQIEEERRMAEARDAAELANRSKSEFLANMSHEIRTPMTAILGFADLLDSGDLLEEPDQAKEAIRSIRGNADHLLRVINDILDMSKIEAGQLGVEILEVNLPALLQETAETLRARAGGKGIDLGVEYRTAVPRQIHTDPTRFRQILINLLGNAIKFTEVGGVAVLVCADREHTSLRVEVRDTGIGMSPEQLERISRFEAFVQADYSTTRKYGGTGLGLRVSDSLARMLGGGLEIRSELGAGSSFTVQIDFGELESAEWVQPAPWSMSSPSQGVGEGAAAGAGAPGSAPIGAGDAAALGLDGVRVLLAEDGPDNQRLISFLLGKAGAEVELADNGRIAVERILDDAAAPHVDVVLMDMQMPEMDGYTATTKLREAGYRGPVIALTAHAMTGDRERCIEAGCSEYLTKPVDRAQMVAMVAELAKGAESAE